MANFGEMATVGAAVKEDCDFGKAAFWGRTKRLVDAVGGLQLHPRRLTWNLKNAGF